MRYQTFTPGLKNRGKGKKVNVMVNKMDHDIHLCKKRKRKDMKAKKKKENEQTSNVYISYRSKVSADTDAIATRLESGRGT